MADPTGPIDSEQNRLTAEPEPGKDPAEELERLRELLLGKETRDLGELRRRFDDWELTPEEVAEKLPEAIGLRTSQDESLGRALAPTLEAGISESVQRNPQQIAQAIYPILGPAVRKAISDTVTSFVETLNRAIDSSFSIRGLKWRFESIRTGVPYPQIVLKHALVYQVEQVFLIHAESGLLLAHVAVDESKSQDGDLVSAMLTAIRDFVADSFDSAVGSGGLRRFKVGDLTVLVEAGPRATLAAVVRGQPKPEMLREMQGVLETVHLQFRVQLAEFEGDTTDLEPADPIIADLLQTVVATDRPQERGWAPKIAWGVAGLLLIVLLVLSVRSRMSFGDAVQTLRSEPGLTLIEADRGFRTWTLQGLRDPLARDPLAVLAGIGVDTGRVAGEWEPYMSFDPEMTLARSRAALDPPEGIELSVEGGVLRATGTASAAWAWRARSRATALAGVSDFDLVDLEVTVPPDIGSGRAEIEAQLVLFDVGSARLTTEALELLDQLAPELRSLQAAADDVGYAVQLQLTGRTDSSGTEETNQTLSARRAQAVLAALVVRGLEPDVVSVRGIGVADPIRPQGDTTQDELNRSVSFEIALSGWENAAGGSR